MAPPDTSPRITFKEALELGVAEGTLKRRLIRREWETIVVGTARNGKPIREILLSSLPRELQLRWAEKQRSEDQSVVAQPVGMRLSEELLNRALKRYTPDEREVFLWEAYRLAAIVERYDLLEPKRVRNENSEYEFAPSVLALCKEAVTTDQVILAREPRRAQCPSPYTLDGWSRRNKQDGLLTFLRSPANPNAKSARKTDRRQAVISAAAVEWVNSNWNRFATARALYKALLKRAQKEQWTIPSERSIYRKWKSLPAIVRSLKLSGEKQYASKHKPFVPRDNTELTALQILCGDHSVRDVTVRLHDGTLARPWLTLWQDLRTGLLYGWHLDITPSSRTIGLAYANGVRTFGAQPPGSAIYTDQGKDYKSRDIDGRVLMFKRAAAIDGGLEFLRVQREIGLLQELGDVEHLLARGYNAREKQVERVHRDISDWEQNTFEIEFCGRDAKNKPEAWHDAWQRHERLRKKAKGNHLLLNDSPFMAIDDYRDALAGWITEYNHSTHERTTLGGAKVVPIEEYERLYTTRYEISEETLALLLMKVAPSAKTIQKNGIWLHQRNWWYLHPAMALWKGHDVEVRYSEDDYSQCWVVLPNSDLCQASLITPSAIRNPNKQTLGMVRAAEKHERKVVNEFNFITQSRIRGESTEERVAALIEPAEVAEAVAAQGSSGRSVGVGGGTVVPPARVHKLTRMDRTKFRTITPRVVLADEVSNVDTDDELFSSDSIEPAKVKEFDYED